ncbi:glutathione S-transferase family protein [Sphingomonas oryzagri]|jgi:glutathione S-transferase|uniref:Glutathione S-transferase family protein n=1 Tax=Sphingomonas oryzagri TaxID=3042314 RepID=A0ABT6MYS8_9SPHN|nr:glutathione S-transferase family protein [Sphingomonas oryzagri]MDH7638215.1 glutathione S-transferase family protein [Sphingomonas oryzagri]
MSSIVVHHLGISQSDRIVWLCEELGLDYELRTYQRDSRTRLAPAEYRALTPFGTAPVITDGDLVLGESGAIIEYLIEVHGEGRLRVAPGEPGYADYLFWFHFANGSLMPAAMVDMVAGLLKDGDGGVVGALRERLDRAYEQIEERLSGVDYLAGDSFTAADIISAFPLTTMRVFAPRDLSPYPNIRAYLLRIGERAAFRRAMAKADPGFEVPLF